MLTIPLTQGLVALIDDDDGPLVLPHKWTAERQGGTVYAKRFVDGHTVYMHRLILPVAQVDHKDGNGLNNQRHNLRPATHSQNGANSKGKRRYKGVRLADRTLAKPWTARIKHDYKETYLGYYKTAEEAAKAYDTKARELFGEYAKTNFEPETEP